ncbi:MAG: membrane protein insertase YidC [Treponema sp.]|nr:membrane protein insertase YidC [Treponema sp.]
MNIATVLYTIILYPLIQIIEISYFLFDKLFSNSGIAIIGVSLTVTVLCLPLYIVAEHWQQVERDTQKKLKPGIERIKETFSGDEQYMILSAFYKENHYHPIMALRSSFGLLIQIPFFMAAYSCLSKMPALQGQSFLFIRDMGLPDAIFHIGNFAVNILPITMTIINIIAGAIYTKGFQIKEKIQIYGMALLFLVILYNSPSGLVLYWTMNNVFSLIKNIFYKLKNPLKVLYICLCAACIFVAGYVLFFYDQNSDLKIRLALALGVLLITGISIYLKAINWIIDVPLKSIKNNSKIRFYLFLTSGIALALLTGLVLPSNLISSSTQEFSNIGTYACPTDFLHSPFWQSIGLFVIWPLCIYFLFKERIQTLLSSLFTILLIGAVINAFVFHGDYGTMDITLKFIGGIQSQSKSFILINLIVWITIIIIPLLLFYFKKEKLFLYASIIAVISFSVLSIVNTSTIKNEYKSFMTIKSQIKEDAGSTRIHLSKTGKNVFILMLDRAESSYFPHILKANPNLSKIYSGFTYYPNTVSYNGHTLMASPALFGGYEYTPLEMNRRSEEPLIDKHNESLLLIPRILTEQADFTADIYDSSWGNYSYEADMSFTNSYEKINGGVLKGRYTGDIKKKLDSYDSNILMESVNRNLFFVSLFREVPAFLRDIVYYKGTWWCSETVSDEDSLLDWYATLYYLSDISDFENKNNSLTIITNEATHANEDISYLNLTSTPVEFDSDSPSYETNIVCLETIGNWLNFLKENNVYDNTRIIIVADHGIGYGPTAKERYTTTDLSGYPKDSLNPLLLVKDFNASGNLVTDNTFMTNADTPFLSIKDLVSNPTNPFTGNLLDDGSYKKNGVTITTDNLFKPHHSSSKNIFTVKDNSWFTVKDNIFIDENWKSGANNQ